MFGVAAGSGMVGRCRNAVARPMNPESCFAGVESFPDEDSEGPARVERGRSMRSRGGSGMGISRHQPRCLGVAPSAAGVLRPGPVAPSHSDRLTHNAIVDVGEAGLGELIVQAVVPAAVAGHVDFQGVESVPVLPERLPQGRDRRLAKDFAMMTMAFPI